MKCLYTLLLLCFISFSAIHAQLPNLTLRSDISVSANGAVMRNPWAGGINNGQFSTIDLDRDGILDLVVFDRSDHSFIPFLNGGTAGQVDYHYAPQYIDSFPDSLFGWMLMRDYNGDGHYDIFAGTPTSNVRVYRNMSAEYGYLYFKIVGDPQESYYSPTLYLNMFAAQGDFPAIEDADADGDLDFFTFDVLGTGVEFHKNIAADSGYGLDTIVFVLQSSCFGHFSEAGTTCQSILNLPPCGPGMLTDPNELAKSLRGGGAHAGSTMLGIDLNQNSLLDLIVGDLGCNTLYALRNAGTFQVAHFDSSESDYPSYDVPVDVSQMPAAFYLDVDNDGRKDMISAPNLIGDYRNTTGCWFYQNQAVNNNPYFQFQQNAFLQEEMIERGSFATVSMFDYDRDSLDDLIIGNYGHYGPGGGFRTGFELYLNKGTKELPSYTLFDDNYLGIATNGVFSNLDHVTPAFVDIDGDGDQDFFFGSDNGRIVFFGDNATAGNVAQHVYVSNNYAAIDVGSYSTPFFYDMDNDNDFDLLIGTQKGLIHYYENTGNPSVANFVHVTDSFGKINITDEYGSPVSDGYAKPFIIDYDGDGNDDLLVGTFPGHVEIYENISVNPGAVFTYVGDVMDGHDFGGFSAIYGAVIDTSEKNRYFIGGRRGGVQIAGEGSDFLLADNEIIEPVQSLFELYPNPAKDRLFIRISDIMAYSQARIRMYNLMGELVFDEFVSGRMNEIEVGNYQAGLYLVTVESAGKKETKKIILTK